MASRKSKITKFLGYFKSSLSPKKTTDNFSELQAKIHLGTNMDDSSSTETNTYKTQLKQAEHEIKNLQEQIESKDLKLARLEEQLDQSADMFREQLSQQGQKIRQLNQELNERTATVTQLSTQVPVISITQPIPALTILDLTIFDYNTDWI